MRWTVFLLVAAVAEAKPARLFSEEAQGTVVSVGSDGKWRALKDATVRLGCDGEDSSEANHWRVVCKTTLRVERGGKLVARRDNLDGVDYQRVAGNAESVKLDLLSVDDKALIVLRIISQEGDMWMRRRVHEQLFVVDGATLRDVYGYDALRASDPGPDGADADREHIEKSLAERDSRTGGVPDLTLTTTVRDDAPADTRVVWNGQGYAEAAADAGLDIVLAKIFAGQRVSADELRALSSSALQRARNAPYARHGRPFKNAELQAFFYGSGKRQPNPAYKDNLLDAVDYANIAAAVAVAKH